MLGVLKREPLRLVAAVQTTLAAAVLLHWLTLTTEQLGGIIVAFSAWLAVVTRSQVTPVAGEDQPADDGQSAITLLLLAIAFGVLLLLFGVHLHHE